MLGYENKETFAEITTAYKDYTRPKADLISQLKTDMSENKQLMRSNPYTGRPLLNDAAPTTDYLKANRNLVKLSP